MSWLERDNTVGGNEKNETKKFDGLTKKTTTKGFNAGEGGGGRTLVLVGKQKSPNNQRGRLTGGKKIHTYGRWHSLKAKWARKPLLTKRRKEGNGQEKNKGNWRSL